MTEHSQACLELAFSWLVTAHDDIRYRGYLKDDPRLIAYRLGLVEPLIERVRTSTMAEPARVPEDTSYDPAADHHEEVAEFEAHQGDCDWCPVGSRGEVTGYDPDGPYADLLRSLDALGDGALTGLASQMSVLSQAPSPHAGVYDAMRAVIDMVLSTRVPDPGPEAG